jgi:signal-transduction protein with cAMP-binding, CBS, and nucleotidyltransferase domain
MYSISSGPSVKDLVEKELVVLPEDSLISDAVVAMKDRGISSVLVRSVYSFRGNPNIIGIVTEKDILYKVIGGNKGPYKTMLGDVMSSPVITIDAGVSVTEAMSLMRSLKIRRLLVLKKEKIKRVPLGLVTLMSIIGNVPIEDLT